ncbi:MAG: GNAT family N-acetyltransferase [Actinomycetota bacterium]|nr:GNAT family N-acetyltransferase [Actinomycetota bacterium]
MSLRAVRDVDTLEHAWEELASRTGAVPWVHPGWIRAWWTAFGRGSLEIIALEEGARLRALLPLRRWLGGLWSTSNWHTPTIEIVADGDDAALELVGELMGKRPRSVSLYFLERGDPSSNWFRRGAARRGFRIRERLLERSPFVTIHGPWETYESSLNKKLRSEIRRRRKRLQEQGELVLEVVDGGRRLNSLLDQGFKVEAAGWKGERKSAIAARPETDVFYREVARWASSRGWLRLAFLRLDGVPIGFDYCIEAGGAHYLLKTGFDPSYQKYGPGMIMRYEMLKRAFSSPLDSYEFLGRDEDWKLQWTDTVRERVALQCFAPSVRGSIDLAAWKYARPAVKRLLAFVRR